MLIGSWIAQKLWFLIVVVNIFYDFVVILVILEFAVELSFKSSGMVRLTK